MFVGKRINGFDQVTWLQNYKFNNGWTENQARFDISLGNYDWRIRPL